MRLSLAQLSGPDHLVAVRPDGALVRISGFAQTGPYRERTGFGGQARGSDEPMALWWAR